MPKAYLIARVTVTDPETYAEDGACEGEFVIVEGAE
jgi:hypothetical protein